MEGSPEPMVERGHCSWRATRAGAGTPCGAREAELHSVGGRRASAGVLPVDCSLRPHRRQLGARKWEVSGNIGVGGGSHGRRAK